VLLKECEDIQQQCFGVSDQNGETVVEFTTSVGETAAGDVVISDRLVIADTPVFCVLFDLATRRLANLYHCRRISVRWYYLENYDEW
jgi:hypothetical protein